MSRKPTKDCIALNVTTLRRRAQIPRISSERLVVLTFGYATEKGHAVIKTESQQIDVVLANVLEPAVDHASSHKASYMTERLKNLSVMAKDWLKAEKRNLGRLRHAQEDRIHSCIQSLNAEELGVLKKSFFTALKGYED